MHSQRIQITLTLAAYSLIILGVVWSFFYISQQLYLVGAFMTLLTFVGLLIMWLVNKGKSTQASYLLIVSMFIFIHGMSLFMDIPTTGIPRALHQYFLALAAFSVLFFYSQPKWLKFGVPAFILVNYLFYASTTFGIVTPYVVPDNIRYVASWVNNLIALSLTFIVLYIMLTDIYTPSQLELELQNAVQHHQFTLYYQPQIDASGNIWGAEALIRWHHPTRGLVPPNDFIPLAEQTGLILPIGEWVLKTGCAQLKKWADMPAFSHLSLALNVSAAQFAQANFVEKTIVIASGVPANKLKLELTESSLVQDIESIINKMLMLKVVGIGFALDDFGTGYSSLNYLKRLPLDVLKIDRSFVQDVLLDEDDAAIAATISKLGNSLGLTVVAEGVETMAQRAFLIENGCTSFQGYLFSRPQPLAEFEDYLIKHQTAKKNV